MKSLWWLIGAVLCTLPVCGQVPPANPFFVDSPFPAVHGGNYRQKSQTLPGPTSANLAVHYTDVPDRTAAPWLIYSDKYPNGERVIWSKNSTHIFKLLPTPRGLEVIAKYAMGRKLDPNFNMILFNNHELWVKYGNEFTVLTESDVRDPRSSIVLLRTIKVDAVRDKIVKQGVLYDGNIIFTTKANQVGVIDRQGKLLDLFPFQANRGDIPYHNDFAIDEKNNVYVVSNSSMFSFRWDGTKVSLNWRSDYDFGGNRLQGSGTTPTLMGLEGMDKLVLVCDSHSPANMVAFWRETPPANWRAIPGYDRQLAGVAALPGARAPRLINTAIENSPVCWGYGIAAAQYNGFWGQKCPTLKGVYKCAWNPQSRKLELQWHRDDVNFNNVLAYSTVSNLVYGNGREGDTRYYYYGLDWNTGKTTWKLPLGSSEEFDDPGCQNILGEDGSLTFTTRRGVVQLKPRQ